MTARLAPLALPLLLACGNDKDGGSKESPRDKYLAAFCRVYSDPDCTATIDAECLDPDPEPFGAAEDCETHMSFLIGACGAADRWISDNKDLIEECVAELEAVECGTDSICGEDGQPLIEDGPCGDVRDQFEALCVGDSGF